MPTKPTHFFSCGTKCAAVVWLPDDATTSDPKPGIVMCHGFTGIKEWLLPPFAEGFRSAGFAVLTFDYRGFGESEGQRGRLVPQEQVEDIRNAITFLASQLEVDGGRIGLWGTSFGCGNVVQTAGLDPRPACVVGQVGFGSIPRIVSAGAAEEREAVRQMLAQDAVQRVRTGESMYIDPLMVLNDRQSRDAFERGLREMPQLEVQIPLEAVERILEYEPERVVKHIAPRGLMLIGARHDTAAPVWDLEMLYQAAEEPKRLEILEIEHYEIYDPPHREVAIDLALQWFRAYLAPRA